MARPIRVEVAVYDLLPASRLATSLWYLGCGLYHTAIRLPDLEVEFAFGGLVPTLGSSHDARRQNMTGIFSLPSPEDARAVERLMPGLRYVRRIDLGPVALQSLALWTSGSQDKPLPPVPSTNASRYPKLRRELSSNSSFSAAPLLGSSHDPGYDESITDRSMAIDEWGRLTDEEVSSPSTYVASPFEDNQQCQEGATNVGQSVLPNDLARVLAVIEGMKKEPEWRASQYSLLGKNCNHFTNELCLRLTGKPAPGWINRAAWFGQSMPCLVPPDWLDPPTADDLYDVPAGNSSSGGLHLPSREPTERPTSPLIAVPYVETQPLHIDATEVRMQ